MPLHLLPYHSPLNGDFLDSIQGSQRWVFSRIFCGVSMSYLLSFRYGCPLSGIQVEVTMNTVRSLLPKSTAIATAIGRCCHRRVTLLRQACQDLHHTWRLGLSTYSETDADMACSRVVGLGFDDNLGLGSASVIRASCSSRWLEGCLRVDLPSHINLLHLCLVQELIVSLE